MSPRIAGGYRQEGVGGGKDGRIPIEKSGGCQECAQSKGGYSQIDPGHMFGRARALSCLLTLARGRKTNVEDNGFSSLQVPIGPWIVRRKSK